MTRTLLLVRHAIAGPAPPGGRDAERALTPAGRRRFREVVRGLARLELVLDELVHSPLRRAVETAELMLPLLEGETRVDPRLVAPPSEALLADLEGEACALVGHEPWMSDLLALLLPGRASGHGLGFKKGGVAWLEGTPEPEGMRLVAFLPPRVTRRLGRGD